MPSPIGQAYKKLAGISLGLVILLVQLWIFINVETIFPENTETWQRIILVYLVMQATIFAVPDLRSKLLNVAFLPAFFRIVMYAALTVLMLSGFGSFFINAQYAKAVAVLSTAAIGVVIIHSFYVAVIEELMFRDWLGQKLGLIVSSLIFAVFHWTVYQGDWVSLSWAFLLGMLLFQVRQKISPDDNTANIGLHAGYNLFVLGVFGL